MTKRDIHKIEKAIAKAQDSLTKADGLVSALSSLFVFKNFTYQEPTVSHVSGCEIILNYDYPICLLTLPINEALEIMKSRGYIIPSDFR